MTKINKAACIGGGVIGGGWVARLLLMGVDVSVFDPHPDAARMVDEVLDNARRAFAKLTMAPKPPEGKLTFHGSLEAAVDGAQFIQESVPERLELKRGVITQIDAAAPADTLIGSSTSGLLPSDLQAEMVHPERFMVAHPYNPVYLLPIVELVGGARTERAALQRGFDLYGWLGMKPVIIDKEIEAFVGDRLLETLWREALWLIKDDICTVEGLDDIMRYGFGMRWAQMGLFQTYRIAGGEAGMRHFLTQFGPCLSWPWSKLTDVPDLDDALINKIADQSDDQAKGLSIRELERIRDDNLVGIMQALAGGHDGQGWGAGKLLKDLETELWARAGAAEAVDFSQPLRLHRTTVNAAWVDYNGHMTEFRYLQVFGDATDALLRLIGIDGESAQAGSSYYTVETHIRHLAELKQGRPLVVETQVLEVAGKKLHLFHRMLDAEKETLHATAEHMLLHVSDGRSSLPPQPVADRLAPIAIAHHSLPLPDGAGRFVGQSR